jgi:adenylate cyclase
VSGERVERRLAADVAGYSRRMGRDEAGTLARLKALRRELIAPKMAEHKGRIVKTSGDGMLVEFTSIVEAVASAVAVQHEMAQRDAGTAQDHRIRFRIGIDSGDVMVEDGDIHGDGVNIAARLEGIAEPDTICLSDDAYRQVQGKVDVGFVDLGEQQLKNITRPVRVYGVSFCAISKRASPALALPDKPSIAVLPFQNISGDPEQEYFADGMVEEITTALSRARRRNLR